MVAIVSGSSAGLLNSSATALGNASNTGPAAPGRSGERIYINSATGNLIVQQIDERLVHTGQDLAITRTYNSLGQLPDDNGDNWRLSVHRRVTGLTGTLNTAGSTIKRILEDGTEQLFTYNTSTGRYENADGLGPIHTLVRVSVTGQEPYWLFTDGGKERTERYDVNAGLLRQTADNGLITRYEYTGSLLTRIIDPSGQTTTFTYSGNDLTSVQVTSTGTGTQTLTRYYYDSVHRLRQVVVDLTPEDLAMTLRDGNGDGLWDTVNGQSYVTTYTYTDATSKLIASISQGDGSTVRFTYRSLNGQQRVETYTVETAEGNRTTSFAYSGAYNGALNVYQTTTVTDPLQRTTVYTHETTTGRLSSVASPAVGGVRLQTSYTYNAAGDVTSITENLGSTSVNRVITFGYDANGNRNYERDADGNTITRVYTTGGLLQSETRYLARGTTTGASTTTRYVYLEGSLPNGWTTPPLRFVVSADGRVTEHRYDALGQRVRTIVYKGATYSVAGLLPTDQLSERQLQAWVDGPTRDLVRIERTDYAYDFRGSISSISRYDATTATGEPVGSAPPSVTRFVYDQRGQLLQKIEARGENTAAADDYRTVYSYDGLGRLLTTTEWVSAGLQRVNSVSYDDVGNRTVTTAANNLVTTSVFNRAGELTSVVHSATGMTTATTSYRYDANGLLRMTTDPAGGQVICFYDEAGRKIGEVDADGSLTEYAYNRASDLIKTVKYATALSSTALASLVDGSGNPVNAIAASNRPAASDKDQITRAVYNNAGQLVYSIDASGAVTETVYDGVGRVTDTVEYATRLVIPANVTELRTTSVARQLIAVDTSTTYTIATHANDRRTRTFYNNDGLIVATIDGAGYLIEHFYDGAGHRIRTLEYANAAPASFRPGDTTTYPPADAARDQSTYFFYDGQGRQIGVLDAENIVTETRYDAAGHVERTGRYRAAKAYAPGDMLGNLRPASGFVAEFTYEYDGLGRVTAQHDEAGSTTYAYDHANNVVSKTRLTTLIDDTRTTQARYDALGRVTQELTGVGSTQITSGMTRAEIDTIWTQYGIRHTYDAAGRRTSTTDQNGNTTYFYYDRDNRLRYRVNAAGEVSESIYDALGQLTDSVQYYRRIAVSGLTGGLVNSAITTAVGAVANVMRDARTTYTYAITGQVHKRTTAEGSSTTSTYNAFGEEDVRLEQIDATRQRRSEFAYDARGLLVTSRKDTTGINVAESSSYDAFGRVITTTDARNNVSSFEYDRIDRVAATVNRAAGRRTFDYDVQSRVITIRDAMGNPTTYSYLGGGVQTTVTTTEGVVTVTVRNEDGNITSTVTSAGGVSASSATYEYDADGQLIGSTENGFGESRAYDRAGRLLTITDGKGTGVTTFTYDAANRVFTRTVDSNPGGLALQTTYMYDGLGRTMRLIEPNGRITDTAHDRDGRTVVVTVDSGGLNLSTEYKYDFENRTVSVVEGFGTVAPRCTQYVYDTLGRLTTEYADASAVGGTLNLPTFYRYDANGNLTRKIDARNASTWYVYDAKNRLTHTIDARGAVVESIYDAEDRLIATRAYDIRVATRTFGDVVLASTSGTTLTLQTTGAAAVTLSTTGPSAFSQTVYDRDGRAAYTVSGVGEVTELTYNSDNNVTRTRSFAHRVTTVAYNNVTDIRTALTAAGNNLAAVSANDEIAYRVYDESGNLAFSITGVGGVTAYFYDGNGNVTQTYRFVNARATNLPMDAASLRSWMHSIDPLRPGIAGATIFNNPGNEITRRVYDAANRLSHTADATGVRNHQLHDALGRVIATVDGDGTLTEFIYNSLDQVVKTIRYADRLTDSTLSMLASSAPGSVSVATLRNAVPTLIGRAGDQITRNSYDNSGRLIYSIDASGAVTQTFYDTVGRVTQTVEYANRISIDPSINEVAAPSVTVTADTANDRRTRTFYDTTGNVVGVLDAGGYLTESVYDALGQLTSRIAYANPTAINADGSVNTNLRLNGTLLQLRPALDSEAGSSTDADPNTDPEQDANTYFFYDSHGRVVGTLDPEGYLTETIYNNAGQATRMIRYGRHDANSNALSALVYTPGDNLDTLRSRVPTAAVRHTVTYQYDGIGRLQRETNYQDTVTHHAYDSAGQEIGTTTAFGTTEARTAQVRYDALGRVSQELSAVGSSLITTGMPQALIDQIWDRYGVKYAYDAGGRRISATAVAYDPSNNTTQTNVTYFYYDRDDRVRFTVNGLKEVTEARYDAFGQTTDVLTYAIRRAGAHTGGLLSSGQSFAPPTNPIEDARTTYTYALTGQVASTTTAEGANTTYTYNAFGEEHTRTERIDATRTRTSESLYDTRGLLITARRDTTGFSLVTARTYDAFGRMTSQSDTKSPANVTRFEYDRLGRTVATVDVLNGRRITTYDAFDRVLTTHDALGNPPTAYRYNDAPGTSAGTMTVRTPEGIEVTTSYNRHGQRLTIVAAGNTTTYAYDNNGDVKSISDNLGTLESRTYDSSGRQVTSTDARGTVTRLRYDAANRVVSRIVDSAAGGLALTTTYGYDGQGRVTEVREPNGRISVTSYDNDGRVRQIAVDPFGLNLRTQYTYDDEGRTLTVTEGAGSNFPRRTRYTYDTLGRRTEESVDPDGLNLRTQYVYDRNSNMTRKIDGRDNSTWYVYDAKNRLTHAIDALGNVAETTYDANDRVTGTRDYAISLGAPAFGDVVTATRPSATTVSFQSGRTTLTLSMSSSDNAAHVVYDRDGRDAYTVNALGTVSEKTFDAAGRVTRTRIYRNNILPGPYASVAAIRDALVQIGGNDLNNIADDDLVEWTAYDVRGRTAFTVDGTGAVTQYQYDGNANLTMQRRYFSRRAATLPMNFDALRSWAGTNDGSSLNQTTRHWYDAADRMNFTLDAEGFLSEVRYNDAAREVRTILYNRLDANGVPVKPAIAASATLADIRNALPNIASSAHDQVTLRHADAAGRVDYAIDGEGYRTNFFYDASNNRTRTEQQLDKNATPLWAITRHYFDAANREIYTLSAENYLTETRYDAVGNVTTQLLYDRKAAVPAGGSYPAPVAGDTSHVTHYVYDAISRLTRETRELSTTDAVHVDYTYDAKGNRTEMIEAAETADARTTRYIYDAANRLTDAIRAVGSLPQQVTTHFELDPYGNVQRRYEAYGTNEERIFQFTYDRLNRAVSEIDPLERETKNVYDAFGNLIRRTRAAGSTDARSEILGYDRRNLKISSANTLGEITRFTYDGAGNLLRIIDPNAAYLTGVDSLASGDGYYQEWRKRLGIVDQTGAGKPAASLTDEDRQYLTDRMSIRYSYDLDNRQVQAIDANGVVTRAIYDGADNKVETIQGYGLGAAVERHTYYSYFSDGRLKSVTDPMGGLTQFEYDVLGNQTRIVDANGAVRVNTFDKLGRAETSTLTGTGLGNGGLRTVNTYDRRGNLTSTTQSFADGSDARTTTYMYDLMDRQVIITDGEGFSTTIVYDKFDNQRLIMTGRYLVGEGQPGYDADKAARADSLSQRFDYDAADRMISTTNGAGDVIRYQYDNVDNRTHVIDGNAERVLTSNEAYYREWRRRLQITGADELGREVLDENSLTEAEKQKIIDSFTVRYTYDAANRVLSETTPAGGQTLFTYDRGGNKATEHQLQSSSRDASGTVVDVWIDKSFEYDGNGNVTAEIVPYRAGQSHTRNEHVYDAFGNVLWHHFAVGTTDVRSVGMEYNKNNWKTADLEHAYDGAGNLLADEWRATRYEYDRLGNRIKATDALGNIAHYYYDAAGNLTTLVDAERYVNTFKYDSAGNRTEERIYMDAIRPTVPLSDTAAPALPSASDDDRSVILAYNRANRLTSRTVSDGAGRTQRTSRTDYVHDGSGHLLREILNADAPLPRTKLYTYDLAGRLKTFTDLDNTPESDGDTIVTRYTYDAANNRLSESITTLIDRHWTRRTEYEYDQNNRRTRQVFEPNGLNLQETTTYDHAGNVTSVRTNSTVEGGVLSASQWSRIERIRRYTYDLGNREVTREEGVDLSSLEISDPSAVAFTLGGIMGALAIQPVITKFGYDRHGNRTSIINPNGNTTGLPTSSNTPAPDPAAHTTTFVYDKNNRLISEAGPKVFISGGLEVSPTVTNTYDAAGRLVEIEDPNGHKTTRYYDGNGRMISQINGDNVVTEYDYNAAGEVTKQRLYMTRVLDDERPGPNIVAADSFRPNMTGTVRTTGYQYDRAGRLTATFLPNSPVFTLEDLDANSPTLTPSVSSYSVETHVYDVYGNEVESYDANGNRTLHYYDVRGRKVASVDALGYLTEWSYDTQDNVTEQRVYAEAISDPAQLTLDTYPTRPGGKVHVTTRVYDSASRLVREDGPEVEVFDPNNSNNNAAPTAMRPRTTYTYDRSGNLLSKTIGAGTAQAVTESYFYDAANRQIAMIDTARVLTLYWRDPNGNIVDQYKFFAQLPPSIGDTALDLASQDPAVRSAIQMLLHGIILDSLTGNRTSQVIGIDPDKLQRRSFKYDAMNRVTLETDHMQVRRRDPLNGNAYVVRVDDDRTRAYSYDAAGNRTSTRDEDGGFTSLKYDAAGRVKESLAPDLTRTIMQYDAAGSLIFAYSGRSGVMPAVDIQASFRNGVMAVDWAVTGGFEQQTWVVWDTVSGGSGASSDLLEKYANRTATLTRTDEDVAASFSSPPAGANVYFRVVTQDGHGSQTWSAEQVVTVPPRITGLNVTQSDTSRTVSVTFDVAVAGPTLVYGITGLGSGSASMTFTRQGTTNTYTATIENYDRFTMPAYLIRWRDVGSPVSTPPYSTPEGRFDTGAVNVAPSTLTLVPGLSGPGAGTGVDTKSGGYFVENTYNALGHKVATNEGDGLYREYSLDSNGNILATHLYGKKDGEYGEQRGRAITTFATYDARNRKTAQYGAVVKNEYDIDMRPITRYTYDALDHLTSDGRLTGYIPDAPYTRQYEILRTTRYTYNAQGALVRESQGGLVGDEYVEEAVTEHLVDQFGRETGVRTPRHTRTFSTLTRKFYDLAGRLIEVRDPLGNRTGYRYDYFGRKIAQTDGRGMLTTASEADSDAVRYYKENDFTIRYEYDNADRLIRIRQAQGWHLANDNALMYQEERMRLGYTQHVTLEAPLPSAQQQELIDRYTTYYYYDKRGNRTREEYGHYLTADETGRLQKAPVRVAHFDSMGRIYASGELLNGLILPDNPDHGMQYTLKKYDAYGNLIEEIDPEGRKKTWHYGAFGRLQWFSDEEDNAPQPYALMGNTTLYVYDDYGRLTNEMSLTGKNIIRNYDDGGRLTSVNDAGTGVATAYTYQLTGERSTESTEWTGNADPIRRFIGYGYDALGRMNYWTESETGLAGTNTLHLNIEYDKDGNRRRVYTDRGVSLSIDPIASNAHFIDHTYTFDAAGRVTLMLNTSVWAQDTTSHIYSYDAAGNVVMHDDGTTKWNYRGSSDVGAGIDANNRVAFAFGIGDGPVQMQSWAYDAAGNVLKFSHLDADGVTTTTTSTYNEAGDQRSAYTAKNRGSTFLTDSSHTYSYDLSGRLTNLRVRDSNGTFDHVYDYYADGREKTITVVGKSQTVYEYNVNKQLQKIDLGRGNGMVRNETTRFQYDNEGHIIAKDHDSGRNGNGGLPMFYATDRIHFANGEPFGETGIGEFSQKILLDTGAYSLVKHVGADHPRSTSEMHIVRAGDTLQSLASQYYGNPSLWYVIAEANGLEPNAPLVTGAALKIPNTIRIGNITADNHAVYNESAIIGRTLPHTKIPPPKVDRCAMATGIIISTLLAVIVAVATWGTASAASAAIITVGVTTATAIATTATVAAVAGAAFALMGSIARQMLFKAIPGIQDPRTMDEFSGKLLGTDTLVGGLSGAVQGIGIGAQQVASLGQLSVQGARYVKIAASGLQMANAMVEQKLTNGKITSITGIAVAGLSGLASVTSDINRGAQAALKLPGLDKTSTAFKQLDAFARHAGTSARAIGITSRVSEFVSPWIQVYESYKRDELTAQGWMDAAGNTLGATATTVGMQASTSIRNNTLLERLGQTHARVENNLLLAGALSAFGHGDIARDHLMRSLGQEGGQFIGGLIGQGILAGFDRTQAPDTTATTPEDEQSSSVFYLDDQLPPISDEELLALAPYNKITDDELLALTSTDTTFLEGFDLRLGKPGELEYKLDRSLFTLDLSSDHRNDAAQAAAIEKRNAYLREREQELFDAGVAPDVARELLAQEMRGERSLFYETVEQTPSRGNAGYTLADADRPIYSPALPQVVLLQQFMKVMEPVGSAFETFSGWLSDIGEGPILEAQETLGQIGDTLQYGLTFPLRALHYASIGGRARGPINAMAAAEAAYQPQYSSEVAQRLEQGESPTILFPELITHVPVVGAVAGVVLTSNEIYTAASEGNYRALRHMAGSVLFGMAFGMAVGVRNGGGDGGGHGGPPRRARFEGLADGGPAREFVDVSDQFVAIPETGIFGRKTVVYRYGDPGGPHYLQVRINDGVAEDFNIRADDPALRAQGITGRSMTYSLMKRAQEDGLEVRTVDFTFGSPRGMPNVNTNWDAFVDALAKDKNLTMEQAVALTPMGKVAAELGYSVGSSKYLRRDSVMSQFTRPQGEMPRFTNIDSPRGPGGGTGGGITSHFGDFADEMTIGPVTRRNKLEDMLRYGPSEPTLGNIKREGGGPGPGPGGGAGGSGSSGGGGGRPRIRNLQSDGVIVYPDGLVVPDLTPMARPFELIEGGFTVGNFHKIYSESPGGPAMKARLRPLDPHYISVTPGSKHMTELLGGEFTHIEIYERSRYQSKQGITTEALLATAFKMMRTQQEFQHLNRPFVSVASYSPRYTSYGLAKDSRVVPPMDRLVSLLDQLGYTQVQLDRNPREGLVWGFFEHRSTIGDWH